MTSQYGWASWAVGWRRRRSSAIRRGPRWPWSRSAAAREQARVATEARLEESRTRVDRLEVLLERVRREAAEAGGRVAVLEAALAAERRRGAAGREPRPLRTAKDTASQ